MYFDMMCFDYIYLCFGFILKFMIHQSIEHDQVVKRVWNKLEKRGRIYQPFQVRPYPNANQVRNYSQVGMGYLSSGWRLGQAEVLDSRVGAWVEL